MKVWIGYKCYYDYCDVHRSVVKVFGDELKAMEWEAEVESTETDWREYEEMGVE